MARRYMTHVLEILIRESIKVSGIIGINSMQLENVIIVTPELNDCSDF